MIKHLSKMVKVVSCITVEAGAAGSTDVDGSAIDMTGYDSIMFIVMMGPITTGAATYLSIEQDTVSTMDSPAEGIAGTKQTIADSKDNTIFISDIIHPEKQYVRLHLDRATQDATVAAVAILYHTSAIPTVQPTEISGHETFVDPVAGSI